jgi:zinc protease
LSGSGYVETVQALTREEVMGFYEDWIRPNNAKLVVVGDIEMEELMAKLESRFGDWKKGKTPRKKISTVAGAQGNILYLMDRPEAQQSLILAGHLTHPYGEVNEIAREAMINVLGGEFTSRLNMNLREDKHWAYGAFSALPDAKGQRPLIALAPVQTDKTKESIQEMQKELNWIVGEKPITSEEFEKTRKNTVLKLPGRWETNASVSGSIGEILKYDLPQDYYATFDQKVLNLDLQSVQAVAKELVHPEQLIWLVVGDKSKILPGLQELGFDQVIMLDPEGNPISDMEARK